jgi:hypothetical protein
MRSQLAFIIVLIASNVIQAQQNLVPNGSFENVSAFPCNYFGNYSTIDFTSPWKATRSEDLFITSTPELFVNDTCYENVPANAFGNQMPKSGNAYAGFVALTSYVNSTFSAVESIYVELDSILQVGNNYELCLHLSLSDIFCLLTKKLSFTITSDTLTIEQFNSLIPSNIFYLDSLEQCNYSDWTQICTTFSPTQPGNILTFNVINNQAALLSDTVLYDNGICEHPAEVITVYYYIDDVSLVNKGKNTGVPQNGSKNSLAVYPNPTNGIVNLSFGKPVKGKISVNNLMGQTLINESVSGESITLDLFNFSSGIYFLTFVDEIGNVATEKLVVE